MATVRRNRKTRERTFTGCWKCRARKMKCDEKKPRCSACQRLGLPCDSDSPRLVWVDGNRKTYKSEGRRYLDCEKTWGDTAVLPSDIVDHLIFQCDQGGDGDALTFQHMGWENLPYNPFAVFQLRPLQASCLLSSSQKLLNDAFPDSAIDDKFLFNHYANYVAFVMMPFEHPSNPWRLYYPAVAVHYSSSEAKALYNGLLAHSAFNMANLGVQKEKMTTLGIKYYNLAIGQLKNCLHSQTKDFGRTFAAILTLMMAEIYSGKPKNWRYHFSGAWALLLQYERGEPWRASNFACFSSQSLYIIRIISDTSMRGKSELVPSIQLSGEVSKGAPDSEFSGSRLLARPRSQPSGTSKEINVTASISSTTNFGFTIGAKRGLLECISAITSLSNEAVQGTQLDPKRQEDISRILCDIRGCEAQARAVDEYGVDDVSSSYRLPHVYEQYQNNAFIFATYIYYFRTLFNVPPKEVAHYVSPVLTNVLAFYTQCEGSFSIWPAFIAAVEAYTNEDVASARRWLEKTLRFGLGNRNSVKPIVESVWNRRYELSRRLEIDPGLVVVDWREVMADLNLDILLI